MHMLTDGLELISRHEDVTWSWKKFHSLTDWEENKKIPPDVFKKAFQVRHVSSLIHVLSLICVFCCLLVLIVMCTWNMNDVKHGSSAVVSTWALQGSHRSRWHTGFGIIQLRVHLAYNTSPCKNMTRHRLFLPTLVVLRRISCFENIWITITSYPHHTLQKECKDIFRN